MRKVSIKSIVSFAAMLLTLTACNTEKDDPTPDGEKELTLSADRTRIVIEDNETVTFTVTYDKEDVTSSATIMNVTDPENAVALEGNTFTSATLGEYKFEARRDELTSKTVSISVVSDAVGLILKADKTSVVSEEGETVTFTVLFDGKDVTAEADIMNVTNADQPEKLEGNTFTTYIAGRYEFAAMYQYKTSDHLTIEVVNGSGIAANFYRRVHVMYFTGTWCSACPRMHTVLDLVKEEFPERIISIAIHGNDEFSLGTENALAKPFNVSAYPSAVVDFHPNVFTANATYIKAAVKESLTSYPAVSGIKVSTSVAPTEVTIDTEISIAETNYWKILVAIVQDGIVGKQGGYSGPYTFDDVVRTYLTSSALGDELGMHGSGERIQKTYKLKTDENMDLTNFRVIVAAMNSHNNTSAFYVNNIVSCPLGGSIDYQYEEDN